MHRALLVVDDVKMRKLLRVNLESDGIEVHEAGDESECLRALRGQLQADLVLLDLDLQSGNAWNILSTLQATHVATHIPVIAISSNPFEPTLLRRYTLNAYIQKPFDARDLTARVRRILGRDKCGKG